VGGWGWGASVEMGREAQGKEGAEGWKVVVMEVGRALELEGVSLVGMGREGWETGEGKVAEMMEGG